MSTFKKSENKTYVLNKQESRKNSMLL